MLGFDNLEMETFPQETGNDVDLFLSGPYEQPMTPSIALEAAPFSSSANSWESQLAYEQSSSSPDTSPLVTSQAPSLPMWQSAPSLASSPSNKRHAPPERETKVKKRKQQHQQKDKERRHKINDGLRQLGTLVQSATGTFAKLDQPTIVSSSINLINSLQSELIALRAQLAEKGKVGMEEKVMTKVEANTTHTIAHAHGHHEGACPVFSSMAGAGVALVMIRADDLSIVEANSVLANILGYASPVSFIGTAVWDKPLHSRLYQLDRHGRVVNDNVNPFAFAEPKVKLEDSDYPSKDADSHIDCLWAARTANGNTLSARVTLSVLKGNDSRPTHFLLCSLPSQRSVTPAPVTQVLSTTTIQLPAIEVTC